MRIAPPTPATDKLLDWMNLAGETGILSPEQQRDLLHVIVEAINENVYLRANNERSQ